MCPLYKFGVTKSSLTYTYRLLSKCDTAYQKVFVLVRFYEFYTFLYLQNAVYASQS